MSEYTTITTKGQVTVPKELREKLNWTEGTKLKFYLEGEELKVKAVTVEDELEDLLIKDLKDLGYSGEDLKKRQVSNYCSCRYQRKFI